MIASFHLLEFRRRALSPPKRLADRVEGLKFWRPLNVGGNFGWFREHPSRWGLYRRMKPDFRRWAFYGVWEDEAALDQFLDTSPVGRSWGTECSESLHLWMRPIRVGGPWTGMQTLLGSETAVSNHDPVAVLVRLDLTLRGTLAMWGSAAPGILHHLPASDEMLMGIPLVDRPYVQPVSFTVWRSSEDALAFAYRGHEHQHAVARVRESQASLVSRHSSGRFHPYRSRGTWNGRNPLEQTVRGA